MKTKLKVTVFIMVLLYAFALNTIVNAENLFSNAISNAEEIVQKEEIIMYDGLIVKKDIFNYYLDDIYIPLASRQLIGIDEIEGAPEYEKLYSESDIEIAAKIILKEAESVKDNCGVSGDCHRAAVIWCILNRVDAGYGDFEEVATAPNQFAYYQNTRIVKEFYELAEDVLDRWSQEKAGIKDVGRVLPQDYLWFRGNGKVNIFRNKYKGNYKIWDWSLPDPYVKD